MRPGSRRLGLRTAFAALTLSLTGLGALVAALLMTVTSRVASSTAELVAVVESVRLAEEAELDLLLHDRTLEPVVKASLEAQLRERLVELSEHVTTAQEAAALESANAAVERYFAGASGTNASSPRLVTEAYDALAAVVAVNLDQSRAAQRRSEGLNHAANAAGIGVMLAVPVLAVVGAGWFRSRMLQPVTDLTSAIRRFASGDHTVRADEAGPVEIGEAARHFNDLAAKLSRQRETQSAFLAGVAHDLRSPLHGLKTAFEVLGTGGERMGEAMRRRAADVAGRQLERLENMIEDLLTTTLLDAGRLKLKLQEWDLRITAHTCVELIRSSSASHELRLTVPDHAVLVRCDPMRMEQVLDNLVGNAVKYTPAGGRIEVALSGAGTDVELAVSDDGVGIETRDHGHVFDAFSRGEATASAPGLGLGLFMSRKIVEAHGGSIELRSRSGRGTTVAVRLPRQQQAAREAKPAGAIH